MAVSLDPFTNISNVQWSGGQVCVIRTSYGLGGTVNSLPVPTLDASVTIVPKWRNFLSVYQPDNWPGMIRDNFTPSVSVSAHVNPDPPVRISLSYSGGGKKFLPDIVGASHFPELPEFWPELFTKQGLRGVQADFWQGASGNVQIAPELITIVRLDGLVQTEEIWTFNIDRIRPQFENEGRGDPYEAVIFRLESIHPTPVEALISVTAGMYKAPEQGKRYGTIEDIADPIELGQTANRVDIIVQRVKPPKDSPLKRIQIVRRF